MTDPQKRRQLQVHLAEANAQLEQAKKLADELQEPFEFLGRTYQPKKVITTGGKWDHENVPSVETWEESDDAWNSSGVGC